MKKARTHNKKFVLWLVDSENIRKFNKLKYGLKVKFEVLTQPQTQIFSRCVSWLDRICKIGFSYSRMFFDEII